MASQETQFEQLLGQRRMSKSLLEMEVNDVYPSATKLIFILVGYFVSLHFNFPFH